MPTKVNEYWGNMAPPQSREEFEEGSDTARRACSDLGHAWPDEDGLPCGRCGKPSALPGPDRSSPPYVAERDALIPIAEAAATAHVLGAIRANPLIPDETQSAEWTRKFHETMDVLARALHIAGTLGAPVHPRARP